MAKRGKKEEGGKKEKQKQKPTTRQLDDAPATIPISIDGQSLIGEKKEFSSGSVGWNGNGKVSIGNLSCQVSANIVIVGSKDSKK